MKKTLIPILLLVSTIVGCNSRPYDDVYGYKIEEDVTEVEIKDDNYRNYYEIFVRSFADSDDDGIGDLRGITENLDYIQDLNFTGIWLMPIHKSTSYHKYNVGDYYSIDPTYGTMDDFKELLDETEKRGIDVIIDLVLNHSSRLLDEFSLAGNAYDKYLKGETLTEEENNYKDFYSFFETKDDPNAKGKTLYQYPGKSFYYEANFDSDMPEFNLDSQFVKDYIKDIIEFYLDLGVDGFRLDAVLYYFMNNTTKNVEFLSELNGWVKEIKPDAYIVGEAWTDKDTINKYYESGIDSFFYFPGSISFANGFIMSSTNRDGVYCDTYYSGMEAMIETSSEGISAPFINNHDTSRYFRSNVNLSKFIYGLLAMCNGTTFTYYGDEIGMVGSVKPDENVRISFKWGEDSKYNTKQLSNITAANYPNGTVEDQIDDENSILNYYKKANYLRNKFKEIARGEISLISADKDQGLLIMEKTYEGNSINIIFNFSSKNVATIDLTTLNEKEVKGQLVVDNTKYIGDLGENKLSIPSLGIAILD